MTRIATPTATCEVRSLTLHGWRIVIGTHIGKRDENQDYVKVADIRGKPVVMLLDGMGHGNGGSFASRQAAEVLAEEAEANTTIRKAIETASHQVSNGEGGTTLAMVSVAADGPVSMASVGDSSIYIDGERVNELHNRWHQLIRAGVDPAGIAPSHKSVLTSCIGKHGLADVWTERRDVAEDIMLTSDGCDDLMGGLPAGDAMETVMAMMLRVAASDNDRQDNATIVVMERLA